MTAQYYLYQMHCVKLGSNQCGFWKGPDMDTWWRSDKVSSVSFPCHGGLCAAFSFTGPKQKRPLFWWYVCSPLIPGQALSPTSLIVYSSPFSVGLFLPFSPLTGPGKLAAPMGTTNKDSSLVATATPRGVQGILSLCNSHALTQRVKGMTWGINRSCKQEKYPSIPSFSLSPALFFFS